MGPIRLLVVVALAAAAGACASAPATRMAAVPDGAAAADLDGLAYGKASDRAMAARADARIEAAAVASAVAPAPAPPPVLAPAAVVTPLVAVPPTAAFEGEEPYRLDSGDRLRIVVFGQEGLTNSYTVDASGSITMPLIKKVRARGLTTDELARAVADRLRQGFIREPHVAIEVEIYRPFFILGEVTYPGQYAFVPHITIENAIAIAGGFTPRAYRWEIKLDRPLPGGVVRNTVPPHTRVRPGDTIIVTERWF